MADQPKRRTPAKKGPTKAQALKALGLTQEDLDALKSLREPPVVPQTREEFRQEVNREVTRQMQDDARIAGEYVPPAQPNTEVHLPEEHHDPVWYARNLRNVEVAFRLTRQQRQGEKRTTLKPRGQRGDMIRLQPGDLSDGELRVQVSYGLIEILPEGEALQVIDKQSINSQMGSHPALALLTNERGERYQQGAVRVASDEEINGIKVADLKPVIEGELGEVQVGRGGIQRDLSAQNTVVPAANPSIVSDGFAAQNTGQLGGADPNSVQKDAIARAKNLEGPQAGLGAVNVTVGEVQKT
jgi:hypothetical protein